jgi:outer membrane protein TolC
MKNKAVLTLLLLVSLLQAQEQKQTYSFSLQQAIDHALQHNYAALNANRDIDAAKQKKWETTAAGLPQISGSVSYLNNFDFTLQGISGNAFNPNVWWRLALNNP